MKKLLTNYNGIWKLLRKKSDILDKKKTAGIILLFTV